VRDTQLERLRPHGGDQRDDARRRLVVGLDELHAAVVKRDPPSHRLLRVAPWLALALLVALDHAWSPVTVPHQGAFIGALISVIVSAFGWLADKAVTIAITVAQAAVMIGVAIAEFAVAVAHVFLQVWGVLGKFWGSTLRPFISWTWQQIVRFEGWLQRTFKPVIEFLQSVRREFLKIYDKWFAPIFNTIEIVRRMLQVLASLHLEWARELDRKLAAIEDRLLQPITFIMRRLNEAINIVNSVVSGFGLFQRLALLKSLIEYQRGVFNALHNARSTPVTDADRVRLKEKNAPETAEQILGRLDGGIRGDGSGLWTPAERAAFDELVFHGRR
jgi:hypothetical protein